jgi:hypothetical protein
VPLSKTVAIGRDSLGQEDPVADFAAGAKIFDG